MGGIHGALFAIFFYGSLLLTPLSFIGLLICGVVILAGKWNAEGFHSRWLRCRKWVAWLSIPLLVFVASCLALEYYRSYPNGHKIVYMNASACNMCRGGHVVIDQRIIESSLVSKGNVVSGRLGDGRTFVLDTTNSNVTFAAKPASTNKQ